MSNENGKITAPITASEPYNVLGVSKLSIGYDIGYICRNEHNKINKWSRHKPIRFETFGKLTDTQASYVSWGLDIKKGVNNTDYETVKQNWEYLAPRGGSSEPYRLGDFDGYDNNATPFIVGTGMRDDMYKNIPFYADLYISDELTDGSLTIDDFIYLKTCYFAAIIKNNSRARQVFITADEPISGSLDFSRYIEYDITNDDMFQVGDKVEVLLFLSSNKAGEGDSEPLLNIYSVRATEEVIVYKEFTILAPKQQYYFTLQILVQSVTGYDIEFGNFLITMHAPKDSYAGGILDGGYLKFSSNDISYSWGTLQVDYKFDTVNTNIEEDSYLKEYTYNVQVSDLNEKWVDAYFCDKAGNVLATASIRINSND